MIAAIQKFVEKIRKPDLIERGRVHRSSRNGISSAMCDDLVAQRGFGIYSRMRHDPDVKSGILIKTGGVLSKGWQVTPARGAGGQEVADFVEHSLKAMKGSLDDALEEILGDALCYGTAIAEKVWQVEEGGKYDGRFSLKTVKPKDPAAFTFETDDFNNLVGLKLRYSAERKSCDPAKFAIFTYQPEHGNPWGSSDLRAAYQWWAYKTKLMQWWVMWLERYGMPAAKGTVPKGAKQSEKEALLNVLSQIQQETAIVVEDGTQIDLLTANTSHNSGYKDAISYCGRQITKAILGQTLTTDEGARSGSLALGKVHQEVLAIYIKRLKRSIEEFVVEQIIKDLVDFNFENADCPSFTLMVDDRDILTLTEVVVRLADCGAIAPDESWVREYLGLPGKEIA